MHFSRLLLYKKLTVLYLGTRLANESGWKLRVRTEIQNKEVALQTCNADTFIIRLRDHLVDQKLITF